MGSIAGMAGDMLRHNKAAAILVPLAARGMAEFLDRVIAIRQQLVSEDAIEAVVALLVDLGLDVDPSARERVAFLAAVGSYHEHMNRKRRGGNDPATEDWARLGQRFLGLPNFGPVPAFYGPNYGFLCFKRAKDHVMVEECYRRGMDALGGLPQPEEPEAGGHLHYNWSKYLLETGRRNEALKPWQRSAERRIVFYELLKQQGADRGRLLAAVQQIVKMRYDFPHADFFPEVDLDLCMVSQGYYDGLVAEYGDAAFKSCVTRPKQS